MLTKNEALELVSAELLRRSPLEDSFQIVESSTLEKSFGWVFFYNSKRFIETGNFRFRLAGNGPVIVNKITGNLEFCGSNKPVQLLIDEYEKNIT